MDLETFNDIWFMYHPIPKNKTFNDIRFMYYPIPKNKK